MTTYEMAEEVGAVSYSPPPMRAVRGVSFTFEQLDAFAELVRADEREENAKVCENIYEGDEACGDWPSPEQCAAAIRARGNT